MSTTKEKSHTKAVTPVAEKSKDKGLVPFGGMLPMWANRLGFPDLWQAFEGQAFAGHEMKVEELREDGTIVVRAEVPGVDPAKDIDVTVEDGMIRIHAERTEEDKHEDAEHYRSEFRYGSFTRTIALPREVTADDITATYRDGILEVRVPVPEHADLPRKVAISRT